MTIEDLFIPVTHTSTSPPTMPQQTFLVNGHVVASFVSPQDVQNHLRTMAAFYKLHDDVEPGGVRVDAISNLPIPTRRQQLYFARAQHRFKLWLEKVVRIPQRMLGSTFSLTNEEIPPLDVLFMLHSYMLSPWNYYEDCIRYYPYLGAIGAFPLEQVCQLISEGTHDFVPTPEQVRHWCQRTGEPFTLSVSVGPREMIDIICPRCKAPNIIPWVSDNSTVSNPIRGFGESNFTDGCACCRLPLTHDALCVGRLINDIDQYRRGDGTLSHTLLDSKGSLDIHGAQLMSAIVMKALDNSFDYTSTLKNIRTHLLQKLGHRDGWTERIDYIIGAYSQYDSFALDLQGAVLRQGRNAKLMHDLQWCYLKVDLMENSFPAVQAIERYHQFLNLNPIDMAPSEDIDVVFHTHQLSGSIFRTQVSEVLGRFINHDDSIEKTDILSALDKSVQRWKETRNFDYLLSSVSRGGYVDNGPKKPHQPDKPEPDNPKPSNTCTHTCGGVAGEPRSDLLLLI